MESLKLHTGAPTEHWEDNRSFISVVEAKIVTPRVKHIDILSILYNTNLTMVPFFQNMKIQVSFQKICAQNHVQVL